MPANETVKTTFTLRDQLSKGLKQISKNVRLFGDRSEKSFKKASLGALNFKTIIGGILGAGILTRGFFELRRGVRALTEEVVSFDDAITQAAAKFPEGIKRGSKEFKALGMRAREVAAQTKFTATEAAGALDFMAFAGFSANQAMALLPQTTTLATVANVDLARSTDIATDALGAFNLRADNTADLTRNLTRINDVFAKTITTSNTNLEQLFEGLKQAGPVATAAGVSLEQTAAITGTLANAGIKGSLAGTQLKNMFLKLTATTPKAEKMLAKLGVRVADEQGNMRDFFHIIQDFEVGLRDMGSAQKSAALNTIFGRRAVVGMNNILNIGSKELRRYSDRLNRSAGTAKEMAADIEKSLGNQLLKLKSAAIELGMKFVDEFGKNMPGAIAWLTKAIRSFDIRPVVDAVKDVIMVVTMFRDLVTILIRKLEPIAPLLIGVASALALMKIAIAAVTAVQWLWNAAMTANPIGLIIVGIGALIGAIALLVVNWDNVVTAGELVWTFLQIKVLGAIQAVTIGINNLIEMINKLGFSFGKLSALPIPDALKERRTALSEQLTRGAKETGIIQFAPENIQQRALRLPPQGEALPAQPAQFTGRIDLAGAPAGTTFEGATRGPATIDTRVLGVNP
jgi:TP901 family phage tail tape measure protein